MKLDPRHLEILAAIVRAGGLTEGAALVGKSQPSVSRAMALLESRVGAALFAPGRRPMQPTALGLALAREGEKVLEAGRAASRLAQDLRAGAAGAVRVAGAPIFMDGVISGVIAEFQADNPAIVIEQSYGYPAELLDRVSGGALDLAIVPIRPQAAPEDLEFRQILPGRNVIACRPGHPLLRAEGMTAASVGAYPWIAPPADSPLWRDLRAGLDAIGVREPKISFTGGSLAATLTVLLGSDALTVLPWSVVWMLRRRERLATLPLRIGDADRHLGVVTRRKGRPSPQAARFIAFVEGRFSSLARQMDEDPARRGAD